MKKTVMIMVSSLSLLVLNGCGGGDNYYDTQTYYLQTYNNDTGTYEGVEDVYYECGPDIVNYTGRDGSFTFVEGDTCTFYDLDETLSYEYDVLYIGADRIGQTAPPYSIGYDCASGISGYTDQDGMFIFDPSYVSRYSDGDVCALDFW